jgi:hypothetical protein
LRISGSTWTSVETGDDAIELGEETTQIKLGGCTILCFEFSQLFLEKVAPRVAFCLLLASVIEDEVSFLERGTASMDVNVVS